MSTRGFAGKSIIFAISAYCLLLALFPFGWVILISGAMLQSETVKKMFGIDIPATKTIENRRMEKD
ncbi:hypothetical protein ACSAZK_05770 [Methanosarcina sp. Mfa9]|uniref:hypothetical protein n=1 Tax=Methanosarcina sp. Mfa9 TaxID=3439063 RepID=UPI003F878628